MTMTEGMVSEWFIADGDEVKQGELLYALETEKINLDVDADASGIVRHSIEPGVNLAPGDVVGYIYEPGETIPDALQAIPSRAGEGEVELTDAVTVSSDNAVAVATAPTGRLKSSPAARRLAGELGVDITVVAGTGPGGRIVEADVLLASTRIESVKASPLARRLAEQRGIDLSTVTGSGPGGRIVQADLDGLKQQSVPKVAATQATAGEVIPLKGMRKTIAQRMHQSLQESAQLSMDMLASMEEAVSMRSQLLKEWEGEARPTFTDFVVKAAAKALLVHPQMNSVFAPSGITLVESINIGIAVAVEEGLMVPVVRDADKLTLKDISIETARLASGARDGTLNLDDYAGGTFTLSALGMFGVDSFTPIINQPQSGILGINRIFDGLTWDQDKPVKTKQMNLSLTWDHRVIDGAPAAEFLATVVELLSEPYRLLV
jgi:pyruvate dehydrogenase E2 component (dihydrolipoamide acetyltransferase)